MPTNNGNSYGIGSCLSCVEVLVQQHGWRQRLAHLPAQQSCLAARSIDPLAPDMFVSCSFFFMPPCRAVPCRTVRLTLPAVSIACCTDTGKPRAPRPLLSDFASSRPLSHQPEARHVPGPVSRHIDPCTHLCSHVSRAPCFWRRPLSPRTQARSGCPGKTRGRLIRVEIRVQPVVPPAATSSSHSTDHPAPRALGAPEPQRWPLISRASLPARKVVSI